MRPTARITPISRARSTTLMLIVPVRPRPPTTPRRSAIVERKITRTSKRRSCVVRTSAIVVVAATRTPTVSRWSAAAFPTRSWVAGVAGLRAEQDHRRPAHLAGGPLQRPGVRVEEGALGGRLHDPHQRPRRVAPVDPQGERVADPEVRLVLADVRRRHERVAVGRDEPAALLQLRPDHRRRRRQPERDEGTALRAVGAGSAGSIAKRHASAAVTPGTRAASVSSSAGPGRPRQLHLDVVVEVGERIVEGLVERRADREDGHEDGRPQGQGRERQERGATCGGRCCGSRGGSGGRCRGRAGSPGRSGSARIGRRSRCCSPPRGRSPARRARRARGPPGGARGGPRRPPGRAPPGARRRC